MIKSFGQWKVDKDGIVTACGSYYGISKEDIMKKDTRYANKLIKLPDINKKSLREAFKYAYRYFHATTRYSARSHPKIYKEMVSEYKDLRWRKTDKGNYTTQVFLNVNITVYKNSKKDHWAWIYDDIHSGSTYKSVETAKKKAFASYYWLSLHT